MKRTTLMIDEALLSEAVRLSGAKTHSAVVARALQELVRRMKARGVRALAGSGLWQGDLAAMRADRPARRRRRRPDA